MHREKQEMTIGEHCLTQVVNIPMPNDKTLDLLFANVNRLESRGSPDLLITILCMLNMTLRQKG